ncbi:MAG: response regulator [Allopontixanthobacter sediminis]
MTTSILIVEDEFLIALEMEEVIKELGYLCAGIADDMQSAMEKASDTIDVALVDVNLMDGATGPIIAEKLASEFGIEVIFVTANPTQLGDGVRGAIGALEKPVDLTILQQVLDYVLALRKGRSVAPPECLRLFES